VLRGSHQSLCILTEQLSKEVLLKVEGELKPQTLVNLLGRMRGHNGGSNEITMPTTHAYDMLIVFGMENGKLAPTTGTSRNQAMFFKHCTARTRRRM